MLHVQEINSIEELAGLRSVWNALLDQTAGGTFFQSLDWLQTYWQFHGQNQRLRVLLVESDGKPIGIMPLSVATETSRVGAVRVLGYPLAGWGSFYGPIGAHILETLQAGVRHIRNTPCDWDLLDLRWVDAATDQGHTPAALERAEFDYETQVWHTSAQVELDQGWEAYWAGRTSHWRNNVRRSERKLNEQGVVEHIRFRPRGEAAGEANPRWDLYDSCVEIARRSWQGSSTTGTTLSHKAVRDYLRAAHATATNAGSVDLNLLLLNGRPVAFAYNYHFRGWVYGVRSGFDQTVVEDGAGTVLMQKMIEDSCLRGDRLIDLGPDYFACKRYWFTQLRPAMHYTHFRPLGWRAQSIRLKRIVSRWLGRTTAQKHPK
jgi:CelD/BcsL family acetyltransferase involved in cellulose biosynthesis